MTDDRMTTPSSPPWPTQISELAEPPAQPYLRGNSELNVLNTKAVAMSVDLHIEENG